MVSFLKNFSPIRSRTMESRQSTPVIVLTSNAFFWMYLLDCVCTGKRSEDAKVWLKVGTVGEALVDRSLEVNRVVRHCDVN